MFIAAAVLALVVIVGLVIARQIVRGNYYVSEHAGTVSIMRGVQGSILGLSVQEPYLLGCLNTRNELSLISADQSNDSLGCQLLSVNDMRPSERAQVMAGLPGGTLDDAITQIEELARSSLLPICVTPPPAPLTTRAPAPSSSPSASPAAPTPAAAPAPRSSPTPAPETPTTVTAPGSPAAGPAATSAPAPTPSPTVTALPPPPPEPGTNCRVAS